MGSGYIQLITNHSNENKILNYNPNITFFKIYYRRYTNFFINNFVIENNEIDKQTNIVNFKIPKNGDLLSKSYLKINSKDNYIELFKNFNEGLYSTLNIDILSYFDSYDIKTNNFNINEIEKINNIKLNYLNEDNLTIKLEILITNINLDKKIFILFNNFNFKIQTDTLNIFYNINLLYNFFSFNIYNINNIIENDIFNFFFNQIDFKKIKNIKIDLNRNFSFNISTEKTQYFKEIINYILNNIEILKKIKIDNDQLYFQLRLGNINTFVFNIINIITKNINELLLNLITNKEKIKKIKLINDINTKLIKLINSMQVSVYYFNIIISNIGYLDLFSLKENYLFGNLTDDMFNDQLIKYENGLLDVINIQNQKISLNLNINLLISLICNDDISIQKYIKIISNSTKSLYDLLKIYNNDIQLFKKNILKIIINPNIFIINNENFMSILFQDNLQNYFYYKNYPFSNVKISSFTASIINYYLYFDIFNNNNNKFQNFNNNNNNNVLILQFLYYIEIISLEILSARISRENNYNYIINNNLFDKIEYNITDIFNDSYLGEQIENYNQNIFYNNFVTFVYDNLTFNTLILFLTETIITINKIQNVYYSSEIYQSNGNITNNINNFNSYSILPLSSFFYMYTKINTVTNIETISVIYNKNLNIYIENLKNNILNNLNLQENINSLNINNNSININSIELDKNFIDYINSYYQSSEKIMNGFIINTINTFINDINNIDYTTMYPSFNNVNINDFILEKIFNYVDNNLYNNTFTNYINQNNNFNFQNIYKKFVFTINTPIYKIYYLFSFLCYFYNDPNIINSEGISDLDILRDLTLGFIIKYLLIVYPTVEINNIIDELVNVLNYNYNNVNFNKNNLNLIENFYIYDNISLFESNEFRNFMNIINQNLELNIFLYNNYYQQKKVINTLYLVLLFQIQNNNYDDKIIEIYKLILIDNSSYFKNFNNILNFINITFKKDNFDYNNFINSFYQIIKNDTNSSVLYELNNNPFYYNAYYTIYNFGIIFDNINYNNNITTNNIYNLITKYNSNIKTYFSSDTDIKKFTNYLDNNNLIIAFKYFNEYYLLFNNKLHDVDYYVEYVNLIVAYTNSNFQYILVYILSDFVLIDCINIINEFIILFNSINNLNISILQVSRIKTFSSLLLFIYFLYFIENCMQTDYYTYINSYDDNTFNDYLDFKYKTNIYTSCINNIISKLENNLPIIKIDYFNFYILNNYNNEFDIEQIKKNFNITLINNEIDSNYKYTIYYNFLNNYNSIIIKNTILNISENFYLNLYNKTKLINENLNKSNFQLLNETLFAQTVSLNENDKLLDGNYDNIVENYLRVSQTLLINNYLNISKSINNPNKTVQNLIYLLQLYAVEENYFKTIYNKPTISNLNVNINNPRDNEYINENKLLTFTNYYINGLIFSSIIFEKEINRILYLFCNDHLINYYINNFTYKYLKNNTLYNIVKIKKLNENNKLFEYTINTALYENIDIFQLFNFDNLTQNNSIIQNKWIIEILEILNYDINEENSYYSYYEKFYNYSINTFENIIYFKLNNNIPVIQYFLDINNYDELLELIFDCLNNYENFSPNNIYNNIINIYPNDDINCYFYIDTDNIKKKIIIYIFINYIILKFIPFFLSINLKKIINSETYLFYNLDIKNVNFKLSEVFENNNKLEILDTIIYYIFDLDSEIDNDFDLLKQSNNYYYNEILQIIKDLVIDANYRFNFKIFYQKFVYSYEKIIGNDPIINNNLIFNNNNPTLSNILNKINTIYNIEITNNNFYLIVNTIKLLDINLYTKIYNLNNTFENYSYSQSQYIIDQKFKYEKTDISTFNLIYNLIYLQLNTYDIFYKNFNEDFNSCLSNLRLSQNKVNSLKETFKGYNSNITIASNFISDSSIFGKNIFRKLYNIDYLSKLVNINKNFSIITPNDYDYQINFMNFNNNYTNILKKYYNYKFLYYEFYENYKVMFPKIYEYFINVLKNKNSLKIIKNNNIKFFIKIFFDIYNSYIGNTYVNNSIQISENYINVCNTLLNLFFDYNYKFQINYIDNSQNLLIQSKFSNTKKYTTIDNCIQILNEYFYYNLFNELNIENLNNNNYKYDVIDFFNSLLNVNNINFIYQNNIFNFLLKVECSIITLLLTLKNNYNINIDIQEKEIVVNKFINIIKKYIINKKNINNFINLNYSNYNTFNINNYNFNLYYIIANAVNKNLILDKISNAINDFIYFINDYSYQQNLYNIWSKYFKNYTINFYYYKNNDYSILETSFSIVNLFNIIKSYLYSIVYETKEFNNFIKNILDNQYINIFSYISNNSIVNIDINIINKIIDIKTINNIDELINLLLKLNLQINFGFIIYDELNNQINLNFEYIVTNYTNYYLFLQSKLNNYNVYELNLNKNIYNFLNFKLFLLFKIINNIDNSTLYNNILINYLINAHKIILNNIEVNVLNIIDYSVINLDFMNKNIINGNTINNYYKNIQNDTIYQIIEYDIQNFNNNLNGYNEYLKSVYYNLISATNITDENRIGINLFFNVIYNFIEGYTDEITIYDNSDEIINKFYDLINNNCKRYLSVYNEIFGGNTKDIIINDIENYDIFNPLNYKNELKANNIFTLIYENVNNNINNNYIFINLFYYNSLIIWLSTKFNRKDEIENIIYYFINLIIRNNNNFYKNYNDPELNEFYDGLNKILFNNYNNFEYINICNKFFNTILNNKFIKKDYIDKIDKIFNYINIDNIYKKYLVWKYMFGVVVDYNSSDFIKFTKSLLSNQNNVIQKQYIDYIVELNNGVINEYGIIQLINRIDLLFDDELIDKYNQNMYKIYIDLFQNINKYPALSNMLGLNQPFNYVDGINPYIKIIPHRSYYIPLFFFFYKNSNAIPLITSMYTDIYIKVYINNTNLIKNSFINNDISNYNKTFSLNSDFIIVERDERKKLCYKQIDNLIERHNNYTLSKNIFTNIKNFDNEEKIVLIYDFNIPSVVKELFWYFTIESNDYSILFQEDIILKKIILNTKFYIDGARRDGIIYDFKDKNYNKITNLLNIYKYNTKYTKNKNYSVYSFALQPEEFQPTGAINMNNFRYFSIEILINKQYIFNYLKDKNFIDKLKNIKLTIHLNTLEYNFVRYQSGLSGLLFI
jgi:hypothetical protein